MEQQAEIAVDVDIQKPKKDRVVNFRIHKFPIDNFVEVFNVDGETKLHTYRWPVEGTSESKPPKAVIMMFHGFGSYVGKYTHLAKMFVDQGFEVCGFDCMGFGYSGGIRGFIKDQKDFYRDGLSFYLKAKEFYTNLYQDQSVPIVGWGYSQGGRLVLGVSHLLFSEQHSSTFAAQILITPNLKVQTRHLSDQFMEVVREKAEADPLNTIDWPFAPLKDISFLGNFAMDELQFKGPHFGKTWYENREIQDYIKDFYKEIKNPLLIVQAEEDSVLVNEEMNILIEKASTPEDQKVLKVYPGDHYIMMDGWLYEQVIEDQIQWLHKVLLID